MQSAMYSRINGIQITLCLKITNNNAVLHLIYKETPAASKKYNICKHYNSDMLANSLNSQESYKMIRKTLIPLKNL